MSNPIRTCSAIIGLAESFQAHFPTYQATEALLAPALLNASSSNPGRSTDIADPTAQRATGLTFTLKAAKDAKCNSYHDAEHALEQALAWMRLAQSRQAFVIRQDAQVARDADATRLTLMCDGTFDALCHRGVYKAGKCEQCYNADAKQRQRARDRSGVVDKSTLGLLETVAYEPRPVEPMLPMRLTSVWCHMCGIDYDVTGTEPTAWLASHQATNCAG